MSDEIASGADAAERASNVQAYLQRNVSAGMRTSRRNFTASAMIIAASITLGAGSAAAHRRGHGWGRRGFGWGRGRGPGRNHHCFTAETEILTPTGAVDVATLRAGDRVITRDGQIKPIKRVETTLIERSNDGSWDVSALPVRVARGALAPNIPSRDLDLSQAHSLYIDGALMPVYDLVNGRTITVIDPGDVDHFNYFHIELDSHNVIIANGAPCETLQPNGGVAAGAIPCTPLIRIAGRKAQLKSRLRSMVSPIVDIRQRADIIRDRLEDRAEQLETA